MQTTTTRDRQIDACHCTCSNHEGRPEYVCECHCHGEPCPRCGCAAGDPCEDSCHGRHFCLAARKEV